MLACPCARYGDSGSMCAGIQESGTESPPSSTGSENLSTPALPAWGGKKPREPRGAGATCNITCVAPMDLSK